MQWRFRWSHVPARHARLHQPVSVGVARRDLTTGTADTGVSGGEGFPDSGLFWSQNIDGLSVAVVVAVVFALVFALVFAVLMGFALMGAFTR